MSGHLTPTQSPLSGIFLKTRYGRVGDYARKRGLRYKTFDKIRPPAFIKEATTDLDFMEFMHMAVVDNAASPAGRAADYWPLIGMKHKIALEPV